MVISNSDSAFRERARYEAARYGADAWVFVRELLQNARDAGARRVWLEADRVEGRDRITCRDDGSGMDFDHARRYLFTLYASNKRGGSRTAGRFGIGFWSVLRFTPDALVVRSRPRRGTGWQVRLDGDLEVLSVSAAAMERGTEVVLERPADGTDVTALVREAVLRDAPFLSCSGSGERQLEVHVNGLPVRAELELPPPSLEFRRPGLRGAVGLAEVPRVEIFAHGLKVRDAASLDDLLLAGGGRKPAGPPVADGLAPTARIDSHRLSVLMARGDAREDRALQRLVAIGQRELRRLLRAELDRHTRPNPVLRLVETVREVWASSPRGWGVGATAAALILVLAGWWWVRPDRGGPGRAPGGAPPIVSSGDGRSAVIPYQGLEGRYRGPDVDAVAASPAAVDLSFRPTAARPFFAALVITGLDEGGRPMEPAATPLRPYSGGACSEGCLEVELVMAAEPGLLRLPLATGHELDPASVRLDGAPASVLADGARRPLLRFDSAWRGVVSYRSGPATAENPAVEGRWPPLPQDFTGWAAAVGDRTPTVLATAAADLVARQVRYDASPLVIAGHRDARRRGLGLFERAAAVGAGDCDVQNAMVAALLAAVGVPARLAVGWAGADGRAVPGLHAWVEFVAEDGRWRVADASAVSAAGALEPFGPPVAGRSATRVPQWLGPVAGAAVLLLTAGLASLALTGRWRREFKPGAAADIAGLLRGAAVRPESFAGAGRLFTRRVVPLVDGRRVSLQRARVAARRGCLGAGSAGAELAARAAGTGGLVVDRATAEGAAVADALGAVDLDAWQGILERSEKAPATEAVEQSLQRAGEPCRLRVGRLACEETAVLVGSQFGLSRAETWLVVDERAEVWREVSAAAASRPARAALLLADVVTEVLGVPPERRRRCLAELAAAALVEAGGGVR